MQEQAEICLRLLELEQQRISALDQVVQGIRNWSIATVTALSGFAISESNWKIIFLVIPVSLLFCLIDFAYRIVQLGHVGRFEIYKSKITQRFPDLQEQPSFYGYWRELLSWPIIYIFEITLSLLLLRLIFNNKSVNIWVHQVWILVPLFLTWVSCKYQDRHIIKARKFFNDTSL